MAIDSGTDLSSYQQDPPNIPTEWVEKPFQTDLGAGRDGFLAHVIVKGLELGERTPEDFIRHFPSKAIMLALADRPILRANILVAATGTKEKTALKKSADSAGDDLQIALDEGDTTCAEIIRLFQPDERVRYLERTKLWAYATESKFWARTSKDKDDFVRAQAYVAFILDVAIKNLLVDHTQVVSALTVDRLARDLPKEMLGKLIAAALADERKFTEETFLSAVPPETLVKHVSLAYIWETVVHPLVAESHGFVAEEGDRPKA
ncbi:hypothetical protein A3E39_02885 [Candidatus Uhrbacteria bacterium RIFCSPHIGHO2_12_FULL_60_25]|uniref:Uncharacterized protein n=1 Tax=Candidatus Uhrbacteria bacterium RIFCSPHIGHO2_12_FULL_60_25 TaxID=1802399 RepID=A0A1F7UJI1_9BACT|nr:MAG: hypothetical protein A3D73_01760 [Candidatus Uhrbacteria bacterium RIFCSPHIGHO2_02_FULL_60_44]OGL78419.1 MAG: hypothetical protein A3E39_02885 [Candidatus Uhrbacteria bacterium RIFCSPHIGHO2_12_FULL_60_25]